MTVRLESASSSEEGRVSLNVTVANREIRNYTVAVIPRFAVLQSSSGLGPCTYSMSSSEPLQSRGMVPCLKAMDVYHALR